MKPRYIIFISFLILISGCAKDPSFPPCEQLLMNGKVEPADLIGEWNLESFSSFETGSSEVIPSHLFKEVTISFFENGDCDIKGPCNGIYGTKYGSSGNNSLGFDFGDAIVTMLGCIEEERTKLEEVYFDALSATQCYAIDESGQLKIHFENESQYNVITFSKL